MHFRLWFDTARRSFQPGVESPLPAVPRDPRWTKAPYALAEDLWSPGTARERSQMGWMPSTELDWKKNRAELLLSAILDVAQGSQRGTGRLPSVSPRSLHATRELAPVAHE